MGIPRNPAVLVVGAFVVVGTLNAVGEMITGDWMLEGGGDAHASTQQQSGSAPEKTGDWTAPTGGSPGTAYGVKGSHWISGHHTGVDFEVPVGTDVHAAADGEVVTAGAGGQYGKQIVIRHSNGLYSQYAHLSKISVAKGDKVSEGDVIAMSGNTGNSTGPHLHFEIRTGPSYGSDINPERLIGQK